MAEIGFVAYADFVLEQLTAEETRKSSLEQRGLAVITSSGILATLAFGSLALAKRGDRIPLSTVSVLLLVAGAVALLVAAGLALATNAPLRHRAVTLPALRKACASTRPTTKDSAGPRNLHPARAASGNRRGTISRRSFASPRW